jgi:endonuclease/exonuclease/phosphatase family metal-dependent hydrolase
MKALDHLPIRILTHNIRYATTSPFRGEELWKVRMPRLLNELRFNTLHNPEAFICMQEVLHGQLQDILSGLNFNPNPNARQDASWPRDLTLNTAPGPVGFESPQEWSSIGVGRDDGATAGEYSPILYRPSIWSLLSFETIWLSETPDLPSKGWDAASIRILTIGVFKHRRSKKRVVAMNTHLDDQGAVSRREAARMIVDQIERYSSSDVMQGPFPVFLAGDLNSEPTQEAYEILNGQDSPVEDAMGMAGERVYGHVNTFTGFGQDGPPKRIDFLFVGPKGEERWGVEGFAVLESRFEDGVFDSDHRAVVGDFVLGS